MEMSLFLAVVLGWTIGLSLCEVENAILPTTEAPIGVTQDLPIQVDNSRDIQYGAVGDGEFPEETVAWEIMKADLNDNCYEHVEKPARVHWRRDWERDEERFSLESPVEIVVVRDGGYSCSRRQQCRALVRSMRGRRKGCEMRENFYIGGDGNVYEGRGWRAAPYWHLRGLRCKAVTVHFLGSRGAPSAEALKTYELLINAGFWMGKLSRDHSVISMGRLLNDSRFSSSELDSTVMGWETRTEVSWLSRRWEFTIPQHLSMILKEQWNGSEPNKTLLPLPMNVDYIMISESGDRCLSRVQCMALIRSYQDEQIKTYGDLMHNFYITEEGDVFEGRGWNFLSQWELKGVQNSYVSIQLCGNFTRDIPSMKAINSLKLLVASGVELGRVSHRYKLVSVGRLLYGMEGSLGAALQKCAEGWFPWSKVITINAQPYLDPLALKKRIDWDGNSPLPSWLYAAKTVLVDDGGPSCFTNQECIPLIREDTSYFYESGGVIYNYYIVEDGHIYEGSGQRESRWTKFFNTRELLTIKLLGSFVEERPSELALRAFIGLLKYLVKSGTLSEQYNLTSFSETYRVTRAVRTHGLEGYMSTLKSWKSSVTLGPDSFFSNRLSYTVDLSNALGKFRSIPSNFTRAIDYVVIGEYDGPNCPHNMQPCIRSALSKKNANFYVGGDKRAWEYRGWKYPSLWERKALKTDYIAVIFIGNFTNALPPRTQMLAFHYLMKIGVETGKLTKDYKILTFRQISKGSSDPGVKLWETIKTWDRWSEIDPLPL